jgi:hypothetical protein
MADPDAAQLSRKTWTASRSPAQTLAKAQRFRCWIVAGEIGRLQSLAGQRRKGGVRRMRLQAACGHAYTTA